MSVIKTIRIDDVDIDMTKLDGDKIQIVARNIKTGAAGTPVQMTKAQASTLGDILKVMAV